MALVPITTFSQQDVPVYPLFDYMDDWLDQTTDCYQEQPDVVRHYSSTCFGAAD